MISAMNARNAHTSRDALIQAGTELFKKMGFLAATVDDVCAAAGVSKGAFFHHFESKEALAEACLDCWLTGMQETIAAAEFQRAASPVDRLAGCMNLFIGVFAEQGITHSCLAGTIVQEVSETHPKLREAANKSFVALTRYMAKLIEEACEGRPCRSDIESLACTWTAAMQGALLLHKASRDQTVMTRTLISVRDFILSQVSPANA